jgi:hypothetical protein
VADTDDVARAAATTTPADTLAKLAGSPDPAIRRAVINNPATPREALLRLAVTDWWEVCRRPGGEAIVQERIGRANRFTADRDWLRSLQNDHRTPASIQDAIAHVSWMSESLESGPEHRRMMKDVLPRSTDDLDD